MKCPHCFALAMPDDAVCYTCKLPLRGAGVSWHNTPGASPGHPAWGMIFAVACGAIPVVALGGCVPIILGAGGASMCLGLSRATAVPAPLRVLGCVLITGGAWFLFVALLAAVMKMQR